MIRPLLERCDLLIRDCTLWSLLLVHLLHEHSLLSMEDGRQQKNKEVEVAVVMIEDIIRDYQQNYFAILNMVRTMVDNKDNNRDDATRVSYSMTTKMSAQVAHMNRLTRVTDVDFINNLRMDRNAFGRLCRILCDRCGVEDQRYVRVEEQVAMFLTTLVMFLFWQNLFMLSQSFSYFTIFHIYYFILSLTLLSSL
ncbi:uncharacterized protein LOC121760239 [Salvia splendens]|uniref:uncharacterized protein LOC121760239 n=1 Tax=Salvia splendens TaxID=180675 RepID=UPI001C25435A|nr:uncharacterized protein LOC121760239 [Salvia splendens]XP_042011819.1 uncharacterized protein LOC121760239 [Salvia splendens]XP_042011820.1 uncharacterized protein LOC121760239 [Salvia splendens]